MLKFLRFWRIIVSTRFLRYYRKHWDSCGFWRFLFLTSHNCSLFFHKSSIFLSSFLGNESILNKKISFVTEDFGKIKKKSTLKELTVWGIAQLAKNSRTQTNRFSEPLVNIYVRIGSHDDMLITLLILRTTSTS